MWGLLRVLPTSGSGGPIKPLDAPDLQQSAAAAHHRVCARVTVVLAQRVVHVRADRQGLVTRSVALGYSPASILRGTLGVRVWTRYGAVTHASCLAGHQRPPKAVVLLRRAAL